MFKKKPFLIVFEGVEGCGKSYQAKKLSVKLKNLGITTVLTREPGGTKSAELIRKLILKDYFQKGKKVPWWIFYKTNYKTNDRYLILLNFNLADKKEFDFSKYTILDNFKNNCYFLEKND